MYATTVTYHLDKLKMQTSNTWQPGCRILDEKLTMNGISSTSVCPSELLTACLARWRPLLSIGTCTVCVWSVISFFFLKKSYFFLISTQLTEFLLKKFSHFKSLLWCFVFELLASMLDTAPTISTTIVVFGSYPQVYIINAECAGTSNVEDKALRNTTKL